MFLDVPTIIIQDKTTNLCTYYIYPTMSISHIIIISKAMELASGNAILIYHSTLHRGTEPIMPVHSKFPMDAFIFSDIPLLPWQDSSYGQCIQSS